MQSPFDRFLTHRIGDGRKAALGRVYNVTCERWRLTDDPQAVRPKAEIVAFGRTASDAADLARAAATAYPEHGFHKPSGAWWGADAERFHRFVVHAGRRRSARAPLAMVGVAALAGLGLVVTGRRRAK
jgi:hypothetical protein